MQVQKKQLSDSSVQLIITGDASALEHARQHAVNQLRSDVKVPGFRSGKVPPAVAEKYIDSNTLQSRALDHAINDLYSAAVSQEKLRPVAQPQVTLKKFVPFTDIEIEATVDVLGEINLTDYKKIRVTHKPVSVTAKDIDDVIESLRVRGAEKKDVARAAKDGDEVLIDFSGVDAANGDKIQGADGKDYPLLLGSNSFIPGFEKNLVGAKAGDTKSFTLTFPKDYGVKALQNRKVTFSVTISRVSELAKPKADNALAAKVGPFKTVDELKADIKKQLAAERQNESDRAIESEIVEKIVEKSTIPVPESFVDEEIERLETEEKRNLTYRGQTWQEHLQEEGLTEAEHREQKRPQAVMRIKGALALSEIAAKENLHVTPEDLEIRLQLLKRQYQDKQMQAELDKSENQQDIKNRMLTEKTLAKLKQYANN